MEKVLSQQNVISELQTKRMLVDMKSKLIQTACNLLDDSLYTNEDAAVSLLDVVELIEIEEKRINQINYKFIKFKLIIKSSEYDTLLI